MAQIRRVMAPCRWEADVTELHHQLLFKHDHALINPLQVEAALWSDLPATPLLPRQVEVRPDLMPRLISLRDMSDAACTNLLERAQRHQKYSRHPFFSALLVSNTETPAVAAHLSRRLRIDTPDGGSALLRYFDPRVFRHLAWLLTDVQMGLLMGRITRWTWRDMTGAWRPYECVETPSPLSRFRLTAEQWGSLQRLSLLNKTLRQIARSGPGTTLDDGSAKRIDDLLREAYQQHRLDNDADRLLYAMQAVTIHPQIHRHPQIIQRLAHAHESSGGYVGACRNLDQTNLRQFATELAPPSRMLA